MATYGENFLEIVKKYFIHYVSTKLAGYLLFWSAPPAPEVPPLQPLWEELPAPGLSPLQALAPGAQPLIAKVDPAIRPAIQKPSSIFFRSFTSIITSCKVKDKKHIYPLG